MWSQSPERKIDIDCDVLLGTACPPPQECSARYQEDSDVAMFWTLSDFHNFHEYVDAYYNGLVQSTIISLTDITSMIQTFPVQRPDLSQAPVGF